MHDTACPACGETEALRGRRYYEPRGQGYEKAIKERLERLDTLEQVDVVVVDPHTLAGCKPQLRAGLLADLQRRSRPGGVHVILGGSRALSPDAIRGLYDGWSVEEELHRRKRSSQPRRPDGLLLVKPTCPPDAAAPRGLFARRAK